MYVKRMMVFGLLAAAVMGWGVPPPAAAQTLTAAGDAPAVFFPEKVFEFAPVIDGVSVVHDFVVFNKGTAPLQISNVRTG
jgi:hypothetical protein